MGMAIEITAKAVLFVELWNYGTLIELIDMNHFLHSIQFNSIQTEQYQKVTFRTENHIQWSN